MVWKLLELLEKRGPNAFDKFIEVLQESYDWLAKNLQMEHKKVLQERQQEMKAGKTIGYK